MDLTFKAKAKDLIFMAKAKVKDLIPEDKVGYQNIYLSASMSKFNCSRLLVSYSVTSYMTKRLSHYG